MASPPDAGGSRYVGRVVDPDVREDGETEPEVELKPSPKLPGVVEVATEASEPEPSPAPVSRPDTSSRGAEVRERLLARARAAEAAKTEVPTSLDQELDSIGRDARRETDDEPEFTAPPASGRAPSAPFVPITPRELSPGLVALFSALVGIATIASITALFMSLEARFGGSSATLAVVEAAPVATSVAPPSPDPKPRPRRARQKLPGPWRLSDARGDAKYRFIEGKLGTESFLKALEAAGAPEAQGYRVLAALRGVVDLDKHKKSDRFEALLGRGSNKLFALEYVTGPEEIYQAKEVDGRLTGSKVDLKVERAQVLGALSYDGSSFEHSAEVFGFDPGLTKVVQRALDGHMSLEELDRGDVLKLVVQEVTVLGEFSRYAGVEALELLRIDPKKTRLRIYYSDTPGSRGYYDRDGHAPSEGGWRKPIKDAPRTSPFNPHRMHPVLHKVMPHQGTDFGAAAGTPVGAASFGTVSFVGPSGAGGNLVKIQHPGGIETGYAHLSRFAEGLKVGDPVKRMQIIGYVGSTGRSTGPHLHFSASRDGTFFDPETLNLDGMRSLSPEERAAFQPLLAKYDPMLDGIAMPERYAPIVVAPAPVAAAAAAAPGAGTPSIAVGAEDLGDSEDDGAAPAAAAPAVTADVGAPPAAPAAPAPAAPAPGAPPAQKPGGSSVYLSDKELLDAQSATDDGEVEE
ncbi:MAG TPA: M23 family metallopeptidase [Polyangiaceae bacterium]|nr:M23 family metallopeptidase [Polyangiaceae bacterium]